MAKVVFDFDDVLWDCNLVACERTGIPFYKLNRYNVMEMPLLTQDEKIRLTKAYEDPTLWDDIILYEGAEKIFDLPADVYINSLCTSQGNRDRKLQFCREVFKQDDSHFVLQLSEVNGVKDVGPDVDILVEDSPGNILHNSAKWNILIHKPYNAPEAIGDMLASKKVFRCYNLLEALRKCEELLKVEVN